MLAIILAAGMATRLRPLTNETPKCLLTINGTPLLKRSMDAIIGNGIRDFVIVTGFMHEKIEHFVRQAYGDTVSVRYVHNSLYDKTNNIFSLWVARPEAEGRDILLLDSDLLYDPRIIREVTSHSAPDVLTLIRHELGEEEMKVVTDNDGNITAISKTCKPAEAAGESLGIEKMSAAYTTALYAELDTMMNREHLENKFYELAFERLIPQGYAFKVLDVTQFYSCELDTIDDFRQAEKQCVMYNL